MPVVPTIDTSALRELNKQLLAIDPELKKQVGKDIKNALRPFASAIMSKVPTQAPVRGMIHGGRTAWSTPTIGVYATPGGGKGSIARLEIFGKGDRKAAFKIADLAGTRNEGKGFRKEYTRVGRNGAVTVRGHSTRSGEDLTRVLQSRHPLSSGGKGGRFAWAQFIANRPILIREVEKILDVYAKIVEGRVSSGS
jgi:hypothetical protein